MSKRHTNKTQPPVAASLEDREPWLFERAEGPQDRPGIEDAPEGGRGSGDDYVPCSGCGVRNHDTTDLLWNCPDFPKCRELGHFLDPLAPAEGRES